MKTINTSLNILLYWPIATEEDLKITTVRLPTINGEQTGKAEKPKLRVGV